MLPPGRRRRVGSCGASDEFLSVPSKAWLPPSYLGKILLVSFVGVHVPLIATVIYLLLTVDAPFSTALGIMLVMLVATLVGTVATLACLYALLAPVREASRAIDTYLRDRTVPRLPTGANDEAGLLMSNVQEGVTRLDAALDAAKTRLQATEQDARGKFGLLAAMSHELRTPLNHIIGFAEILASDALGPIGSRAAYRDYAAGIGTSGGQLTSVIQAMLDLSETAAGDQGLTPETVALADAIQVAAARVHLKVEIAGARLEVSVPSGLDVQADPRALKQILIHALLVSAETAGTGGTVGVTGHRRGGAVIVEIAHAGPGWTMDDVPEEMRGDIPRLGAGASATPDSIRHASAQALRLSMIRSLLAAGGGSLTLAAGARGGRVIRVGLPAVEGVRLQRTG